MSDARILNAGEKISFNKAKQLTFVKELGSGGTGVVKLFYDEQLQFNVAIKKYSPDEGMDKEDCYRRFIDEIKILYQIYHKNIVRTYNYYLYPNELTGYIEMEFVSGVEIHEFEPLWHCNMNDIFRQVIGTFEYLQNNNVIHRDIRPRNILITDEGQVKIIDFGFGKKLSKDVEKGDSIFLNWPVHVSEWPNEILQKEEYLSISDMYFLGMLFKNLPNLSDGNNEFKFHHILDKMTQKDPELRYSNFTEIIHDISSEVLNKIEFNETEKITYRNLADDLTGSIAHFSEDLKMNENQEDIIAKLSDIIKRNMLEENIQNNNQLIKCFIVNGFAYYNTLKIKLENVKKFYDMFIELHDEKREILLSNLEQRMSTIDVKYPIDNDMPF